MKKIILLFILSLNFLRGYSQKFIYGDLYVYGQGVYTGALTSPTLNTDSLTLNGQVIRYAEGDTIPDLAWTRNYVSGVLPSSAVTRRTLYVDKNGSDVTGNGTSMFPYLSISKAVTEAEGMSPDHNSQVCIIIGPGVYAEQVIIQRDGISLYGYGQGVTQVVRAGNCLTHRVDGSYYPWDNKVVGISFRSTVNTAYSVRVEGVNNSSIAGNELQYRDCRMEGDSSFYAEISNYLDFQNTYVMGAIKIYNCAGVWVEGSEWAGKPIIDFNASGDHPSDGGNYGYNWMSSIIRQTPTLSGTGKVGEDYRILPVSDYLFFETSSNEYGTSLDVTADVKSIDLTNSSYGLTQLYLRNNDETSNWAGCGTTYKGSGADFTNLLVINKMGDGYWIPTWAGNSIIATDKKLFFVGDTIEFQSDGAISAPNTVLRIDANGVVKYISDVSANYDDRAHVDRGYVNSYYTGSVTDAAPTDAEIDGIVGTASSKGAGFKASLKDSDGTALMYLIISDGTLWWATALATN